MTFAAAMAFMAAITVILAAIAAAAMAIITVMVLAAAVVMAHAAAAAVIHLAAGPGIEKPGSGAGGGAGTGRGHIARRAGIAVIMIAAGTVMAAAAIAAIAVIRAADGAERARITGGDAGTSIGIAAGIAAAAGTVFGHGISPFFSGHCILCVKSTACQQDIHGQKMRYIHIIHNSLWINLCCVLEEGALI